MANYNNFTDHAEMIAVFVYYKLDLDFSSIFMRYVWWREWGLVSTISSLHIGVSFTLAEWSASQVYGRIPIVSKPHTNTSSDTQC
jgi:hypothetical protein